jgi:hypothetical protein
MIGYRSLDVNSRSFEMANEGPERWNIQMELYTSSKYDTLIVKRAFLSKYKGYGYETNWV